MAERASASFTPAAVRKHDRPGFTTATQNSGLPLPEPIRVSAELTVTGLSGNKIGHPHFAATDGTVAGSCANRAASI